MTYIVSSMRKVAEAFKVSTTAISRDWRALGMPGENGRYDLMEIARWRIRYERERGKLPDDPLMSGDSPALERYRAARAEMAELDVADRRAELVNVEEIQSAMMRIASLIRNAGERLKREFGNDALQILNEAIEDAVQTTVSELDPERFK